MRLAILFICLAWMPLVKASTVIINDAELELRDQARACYLGFIKLYDVDYLANDDGDRCVRVAYLREFSVDQLSKATKQVFAQRHGDEVATQYVDLLEKINDAYEPVLGGDTYTYCVKPAMGGGLLLRDGKPVTQVPVDDFAERFMQIWVSGENPQGKPNWKFRNC
jgi:hypothetical protein